MQRRVDAGARLVEQDHLRIDHQDAREFEQLLLTARQRAGGLVELRPQGRRSPAPPQRAPGSARSWRATSPGRNQLFQNRSPACPSGTSIAFSSTVMRGKGRGIWKVRANPLAKIRSGESPSDRLAHEADLAGTRRQGARDQVEEGRLARAVGTDEASDPTLLDGKVDAVDGVHAPERPDKPPDLEHE